MICLGIDDFKFKLFDKQYKLSIINILFRAPAHVRML